MVRSKFGIISPNAFLKLQWIHPVFLPWKSHCYWEGRGVVNPTCHGILLPASASASPAAKAARSCAFSYKCESWSHPKATSGKSTENFTNRGFLKNLSYRLDFCSQHPPKHCWEDFLFIYWTWYGFTQFGRPGFDENGKVDFCLSSFAKTVKSSFSKKRLCIMSYSYTRIGGSEL